MPLPRFPDPSDADATTEYSGRVEVVRDVEVLTDVTMELLPDETGHTALPEKIAAAIRSFPPVAIDSARAPRSTAPPPPRSRRSPDASLEFPNPLPPELYADANVDPFGEDDLALDDEPRLPRHEPPRWRLHAFAGAMIVASTLVGFAIAGRSRVTTVEETPRPTKATAIPPSRLSLPEPETVTTAAKTPQPAQTSDAPIAPEKPKDKIGTLVTPQWAKGRNVWVDGVVFGKSPKVEAACGKHVVKVGDKGKPRTVVIPCGGKLVVAP